MKVLFITYDFPYPTTSGGKNRAFHLIKLAAKKHEVSLFSFTREGFNESYKDELFKIGVKKIKLFRRRAVWDFRNISALISSSSSIFKQLYFDESLYRHLLSFLTDEKIDILHCESFYTGFYISDEIKKLGITQVFGTENLEYKIYEDYVQRSIPFFCRLFFQNELSKIKREEEWMLTNSDINIAVTEQEAEEIKGISKIPCVIVENGIDLSYFNFQKRKDNGKKLLFVGNFSYFPNSDAMQYFYHEIFKHIADPDLRLTIVGKRADSLSFLPDARIRTIEYVSDIRDVYADSDIFVSPVRIGGGTNFKILEAMATGLSVVADSSRLEGLGITNDEEVLIADTAVMFREKIEGLLQNNKLRETLAKNARKFVEEHFSWEEIGKKLDRIYKK